MLPVNLFLKLFATLTYKENIKWINDKINAGYNIIDIGVDPTRLRVAPIT